MTLYTWFPEKATKEKAKLIFAQFLKYEIFESISKFKIFNINSVCSNSKYSKILKQSKDQEEYWLITEFIHEEFEEKEKEEKKYFDCFLS